MKNIIAENTMPTIFGKITPPVNGFGQNPVSDLGGLLALILRIFLIVAGIFVLIYMFIGAFEVITSGGDKEKLSKAQNKITNAVIGIVLIIGAIAVFTMLSVDVLNIMERSPDGSGWQFTIPHF